MLSDVLETCKDFYGSEYVDLALLCAQRISLGCHWLLFTNEQVSKWGINCESPLYGVDKYQLADGLLVDFDSIWLRRFLREATPFITPELVSKTERRYRYARRRLLERLSKGDSKVLLGFYNTNTTYKVVVDGKRYPSYPISNGVLCSAMEETGYCFLINGRVVPPLYIVNYARACYRCLHLTPSGDAILATLIKQ